jgi:hypothetical protein
VQRLSGVRREKPQEKPQEKPYGRSQESAGEGDDQVWDPAHIWFLRGAKQSTEPCGNRRKNVFIDNHLEGQDE